MKAWPINILAVVLFLLGGLEAAPGSPIYIPLATFRHPPAYPEEGLAADGTGSYWGVSDRGGENDDGTVFKVNGQTGAITTVVEFSNGGNTPGYNPYGTMVNDGAGYMWGTTYSGGQSSDGTLFKINIATGALTAVASFTGVSGTVRGAYPEGGLSTDGHGSVWGTTTLGGSNNFGTVFVANVASGVLATVVDFSGTNGATRGAQPYGTLSSDGSGNVWGTTANGGSNNLGTIYKISESGTTMTPVVDFTGTTGANLGSYPSYGALTPDGSGNLWGETQEGGTDAYGTVFEINESSGVLTTVVDFTYTGPANRGIDPAGGLVSDGAGNLWGITAYGGLHYNGTIFKIAETTGTLTTVADFSGNETSPIGSDAQGPLASDGNGNFFGTTESGGTDGFGTAFEVSASTGQVTTLAQFPYGVNRPNRGAQPVGALAMDGSGNYWGVTEEGGANGWGSIFELSGTSGAVTTVADLTTALGAYPETTLASDSAGNMWGTASFGGTSDYGTVFEVNEATGVITPVVSFTGTGGVAPGEECFAGMVNDGAGNFWGVTESGGAGDLGTVFEVSATSGSFTNVVSFTGTGGANRGSGPDAGLASDGMGNLWGTTIYGGTNSAGVLFYVSETTGSMTIAADFGGAALPVHFPEGTLVNDGNGYLWGTSYTGGTYSFGTVYKVKIASGAVTVVVSLSGTAGSTRGQNPAAGLVSDGAGNMWGTSFNGGTYGNGVIFEVNEATGQYTTVFDLTGISGNVPGANPNGSMILTGSGLLGTTWKGGDPGDGQVDGAGVLYLIQIPPVVTNQTIVWRGSGPVSINPLLSATDPLNFPMTISGVTQPSGGTAVFTGSGVTYQPNGSLLNFGGDDTFTYTVSDGHGSTATGQITVENPFDKEKGNYAGILSSTGGGLLTLTTNSAGTFTGKLRIGAGSYSLKGLFGLDGTYTGTPGGQPLALQFNVGDIPGGEPWTYTITGTYNGTPLTVHHALEYSNANPAPETAKYTMLLPAATGTDPATPSGTGFAALTVLPNGNVTMKGNLADGTPFTGGVPLTGLAGGTLDGFPVYSVAGKGGLESLTGEMTFEEEPGVSDLDGVLDWIKGAQGSGTLYPGGFTTDLPAVGSLYVAPPKGALALVLSSTPNVSVTLTEPDFSAPITHSLFITSKEVGILNSGTDALKLTINAGNGMIGGSFIHPVTKKKVVIKGVILHKQNRAAGYFLSPTQSGGVELDSQ